VNFLTNFLTSVNFLNPTFANRNQTFANRNQTFVNRNENANEDFF
jgi:hypothetical protein